jgi:hypothetical protein
VLGESAVLIYDARRARITPQGRPLGATGVLVHLVPPGGSFDPKTGRTKLPDAPQ